MIKGRSMGCNMNKLYTSVSQSTSFCDFQQLKLQGQQKLLSYGQYCEKSGTKQNRKKSNYTDSTKSR